jgi:hypothetical protein
MKLKIQDGDIEAMMEWITRQVAKAFLIDLKAEVENQIVLMDASGNTGALLGQIVISFEEQRLYVNAPHAGYVEFGTPGMYKGTLTRGPGRAGPPPLEAIEAWAGVKFATATVTTGKGGKKKKNVKYLTDKQRNEIAKKIAWGIYYWGTDPKPFMRNAIDITKKKWESTTIKIEVTT